MKERHLKKWRSPTNIRQPIRLSNVAVDNSICRMHRETTIGRQGGVPGDMDNPPFAASQVLSYTRKIVNYYYSINHSWDEYFPPSNHDPKKPRSTKHTYMTYPPTNIWKVRITEEIMGSECTCLLSSLVIHLWKYPHLMWFLVCLSGLIRPYPPGIWLSLPLSNINLITLLKHQNKSHKGSITPHFNDAPISAAEQNQHSSHPLGHIKNNRS